MRSGGVSGFLQTNRVLMIAKRAKHLPISNWVRGAIMPGMHLGAYLSTAAQSGEPIKVSEAR